MSGKQVILLVLLAVLVALGVATFGCCGGWFSGFAQGVTIATVSEDKKLERRRTVRILEDGTEEVVRDELVVVDQKKQKAELDEAVKYFKEHQDGVPAGKGGEFGKVVGDSARGRDGKVYFESNLEGAKKRWLAAFEKHPDGTFTYGRPTEYTPPALEWGKKED